MKLQITHQTNYAYTELAQSTVQYIRMTPMTLAHQTIHSWNILLPSLAQQQRDGFGNIWLTVNRNEPHTDLQIQASGVIEIDPSTAYVEDSLQVPYLLYTLPTDLTTCDTTMRDFAQPYLANISPTLDSLPQLQHFAAALLKMMPYTSHQTHVGTTAAQAFAQKVGVCQDHTHVFLACVRDIGLPARYVSGYLYDAYNNHLASHAWAEVWLDGHWYTFDVANQKFTPSEHVYVAVGRDYLDAAPVRGMRIGGGYENLFSQVMVTKVS